MKTYAFWNNKGGTGKTSLAFQAICAYALKHPEARVLVIDVCPQANLSELLLGALTGNGSQNLTTLQGMEPRKSISGYFQKRLPAPFSMPSINYKDYICKPYQYNPAIPSNIDLVAGDALVELQSNAIATLSNTLIPGTDAWISVINWINDYLGEAKGDYDIVFLDTNPSFSVYTQIAIAASDLMILPVMADDSSRRAIQNVFALIYGINLPSSIYSQYSFATKVQEAGQKLPKIHLIAKNRLTQYMGPASAYRSVISSIDSLIVNLMASNGSIFSFNTIANGTVEIRDFQTTGVVAFAKGEPFSHLRASRYNILGRDVTIRGDNLSNCTDAIDSLVQKI